MYRLIIRTWLQITFGLLLSFTSLADDASCFEKSSLIGTWDYISTCNKTNIEVSYYPNGISKIVIYSEAHPSQILGYGIANWHVDDQGNLHTLFIDETSNTLGLVTGIEIQEQIVQIDGNHINLVNHATAEIKELHKKHILNLS